MVRAALVVGTTDGALNEAEEKAVRQICDVLGLELADLKRPVKRREDEDDDEDEDEDEDSEE